MKRTIGILLLPLIIQQLHNYESTVSAGFVVRSPLHMTLGDNLSQNSSPSRIPPATALSSSTATTPFGTLAFAAFKIGRVIRFCFLDLLHYFIYNNFTCPIFPIIHCWLTSPHTPPHLPRRIQHITKSTRRQSQLQLLHSEYSTDSQKY